MPKRRSSGDVEGFKLTEEKDVGTTMDGFDEYRLGDPPFMDEEVQA
jgi:hypothetical protein